MLRGTGALISVYIKRVERELSYLFYCLNMAKSVNTNDTFHIEQEYIVNVSEQVKSNTNNVNTFDNDSNPIPAYQTVPSSKSKLIEVVRQAKDKGIKGIHVVSQSELIHEDIYTRSAKGFVRNGEIYINVDRANDDTVIHEFGHLYLADAKNNNRLAYYKLLDKIKDTSL